MRSISGKYNLEKWNLRKSSLWKFRRKFAVVLAALLVLQSMPIRAEQNSQVYASDTETEGETDQVEDGTGSEGDGSGSGSEGDGSGSGSGSEGDGSGSGSEGDGSGTEGEGDGSGSGSEGDGSGSGSEGDGSGTEGEGDGSGTGSEGDGDGTETGGEGGTEILQLEFEIAEPEPQVYTVGKFNNSVRSKDGSELLDVTVQYSIDCADIASIDADTGEVTFLKAGTVNVTANVTKDVTGGSTEKPGGITEGEPGGTTGEPGGSTEGEPGGSTGEPGGTTEGESGGATEKPGESTEGEPGGTTGEPGGTTEGETEGTTEGETEGTTEGETEGTTGESGGATEGEPGEETTDRVIIASLSYVLVIEKAPQTITFQKADQELFISYGEAFENPAIEKKVEDTTAPDGMGYGAGEITYHVISGEDIANVGNSGALTFQDGKTGEVTVKAVKAEDDCYQESSAQYTLTVDYAQKPEIPYTIEGNKTPDAECTDWYSGYVTIYPPDGYLISSNNSLSDTGWDESIVLKENGTYDSKTIYLRNKANRGITDAISVEEIKIDQTAPVGLSISYATPLREKVKELVTFGFYKAKLEITLKAQDPLSGVSSFAYWLEDSVSGDGILLKAEKGEDDFYYGSFIIKPQFKGRVTFTATDGAGNRAENVISNGIVIDNIQSKLTVAYQPIYRRASSNDAPGVSLTDYKEGTREDVTLYYRECLALDFTIEEENFFEEDVVVKLNGEACPLTWTQNADENQNDTTSPEQNKKDTCYSANLKLDQEGTYWVTMSYEDRSQNGKVEYTSERIIIDATPPVLTVDYKTPYVRASSVNAPGIPLSGYVAGTEKDVTLYYGAAGLVLDFTIEEENFFPQDVEVKVNEEIRTLSWTQNTDGSPSYTASLELKDEGIHVVTLSYQDPSENEKAEYTSEHIIIDTTAPVLNTVYGNGYERASSWDAPSVPMEDYEEGTGKEVTLYYGKGLTLDFTIEEENFFQRDVKVEVNGEDHPLTWTQNTDGSLSHTANLELKKEGTYTVTLCYQDPSENKKAEYTSEYIIVDATAPVLKVDYESEYVRASSADAPGIPMEGYQEGTETDVTLYYAQGVTLGFAIEEENFFAEDVEVKVNGEARTLTWTQAADGSRRYIASLELKDEGAYVVAMSYEDPSRNKKAEYTSEHIIIDTTPAVLHVDYVSRYAKASSVDAPGISLENYVEQTEEEVYLYYDGNIVLDFTIEEENFFPEDVKVEVNGAVRTLTWTQAADGSPSHTANLELKDEGTYVVLLHYQDPSENEAAKYTSEHMILDRSTPQIQVTYDVTQPVTGTSDIYGQIRTAVIAITDKNIYPNDGDAVFVVITAKDAVGADVDFAPDCRFVREDGNPDIWKAVIPYDVSANYTFEITVQDMAGHEAYYGRDSFTVDTVIPDAGKFSISYSDDYQNWFDKMLGIVSFGYYRPSVTITFTAEDETTFIGEMEWIYTRQSEESTAVPETETGTITEDQIRRDGNRAVAQITLTADEAAQYRGNIAFKAKDKAGNESYYRTDEDNVIVVDTITPTRTAYYSPARQVTEKDSGDTIQDYGEGTGAILYYDDAMSLTLEVAEANFYAEDVKVYVYRDGKLLENGDGYDYDPESNWATSKEDRNRHSLTLRLGTGNADGSRDGDYVVIVSYRDRSNNEMPVYTSEQITIDTQKPVLAFGFPENAVIRDGIVYMNENPFLEVIVSERNFRAGEVSVIVTAKDAHGNEIPVAAGKDVQGEEVTYAQYLSDAANWAGAAGEYRATALLEEDARYEFVISYHDLAMQEVEEPARCVIVVDREASAWEEIPVPEAYVGNLARMVDGMDNRVEHVEDVNQETRFVFQGEVALTMGLTEANFFPEDVEVIVERDGVLLEAGTDYHYDPQDWGIDSEDCTHHTLKLVLGEGNADHVADGDYRVTLSYTDTSGNVSERYLSHVLTIDTTVPAITVTYDNNEPHAEAFYGSGRNAVIAVTDRNIRTDEIEIRITGKDIWGNVLENAAAKIGGWVPGDEEGSWKNTITYDMDANYSIEILCPDMAGNQSLFSDGFTIDQEIPGLRYEYSTSLMETALNWITFGFYQPDVTVTVYVQDDIAGVDYLTWGYEKEAGSSTVNAEHRGGTIPRSEFTFETTAYGPEARASFRLTASEAEQYRGSINFEAADRAGNIKRETDGGKVIVVDTISPTRTVSYSPAVQVADRQTGNIITDYTYGEGADAILYYDGPMEVAFQINEANFYAEDVVCKVNDEVVQVSNWNQNGDIWSGSISFAADGDYILTMEYTDRSGNEMAVYTSSQITIDTIAPRIETNWTADRVVQTKSDINYSLEDMSVTIIINERNFRAQDVNAVVTAVDAAEQDVPMEDYAGYLRDPGSWTTDGDLHTAILNFAVDANYTFTIEYRDMVFHPSEEYVPYAFTVDKAEPSEMTIEYSTPVLESILNAITFGFYNTHTTVTITAVDATSGVDHFVYSFLRADNVSDVNTELINAQIEESDITYSDGRRIATATFRIPDSELNGSTQFNGTVEFTAFDRTLLETKFVDGKRVVVDTIAPVAEVQYNEPVSMDGSTSYYDGTIEGVINVTEANFYSEDVNLYVSKDGGAAQPLAVTWTLLGMDRNAGAFSLPEDGEYIVSAVYTDRSTNQMVEYQSDLLVVDTVEPRITVSGIGDRSANRDETIGFVVTVRDENLNPAACHPKLTAEVCDDVNGSTTFREIDLDDAGTADTVHNGNEYVYTYVVENLDRDGIYSLTCEAADRAGHSVTEITAEKGGSGRTGQGTAQGTGQETERVMFSVNRNGSTYSLNRESRDIIGTFSKTPVDIVVTEINPDILNVIRITLFRDEKTLVLQEGTDYRVDRTGGDGEWNSYVYTIFAENFENDGVYRISIYSEDEAQNVAENTLEQKNVEISFGIDKTLPNLIVTNLESGQTYPVESLTVNMEAEDNMRLVSVEVWLDGASLASWGEEEILTKSLAYEGYSFVISGESTRAHDVTVALTDAAGNRLVEEINDFYVTTNVWVQFFNNKPLFFGSVAGVAGIVVTPAGIVMLRRRRKTRNSAGT